jgi:hypothetical protein
LFSQEASCPFQCREMNKMILATTRNHPNIVFIIVT